MREVYEFLFVKGGPVMVPIVLGSVLGLALFLERFWSLRRDKVIPLNYRRRVRSLLKQGKFSEAEVLSQENESALAAIVGGVLKDPKRPLAEIKETVSEVGRREVAEMERYVEMLGTVAAVEPLMGLLGTVTGLIRAFQRVEALASKGGGVNAGALAAGIWEALITTAAGLVVAIPAYVGYRYLLGRIGVLATDLEEDSIELASLVGNRSGVKAKKESAKSVEASSDAEDEKSGGDDEAHGDKEAT